MIEMISLSGSRQLWQTILAIFFFHSSEYVLAVAIHGRSKVSWKSLLISRNYVLALLSSFLEYAVETLLFPSLKHNWWVSNAGLTLVIAGEVIRKLAIVTAGRAFTHLIQTQREEHHRLVTSGVYGYVRHPGYCGFFIWSIGTQFMLCNPCSTVAFAAVVWRFFARRISYEEVFLNKFFGPGYQLYARETPSGIPFVK